MTGEHRGFSIYSRAGDIVEHLLGSASGWYPAGSIGYTRRDRSVVELARFRLPSFALEDERAADLFGFELGRILIDGCYRDFVIARYESEKQRIQERERRRRESI